VTCKRCSAEVHEGTYLCKGCVKRLDRALGNIVAYHGDFQTIRTRQTRYSAGGGGGKGAKGKTMPLGMDPRFDVDGRGTEVEAEARNTLTTWVRACIEDWPHLGWPRNTWPAMCGFLQGILTAIAGQEWAGELVRDMLKIEAQLKSFVDRPPEKIYAGTCVVCAIVGDHSPLYAREGDEKIICPAEDCDREYDVAECRETLLATVDGALCTAAEIASLATYFGVLDDRDKVRKRINQWNTRGIIQPDGLNTDGEPTFAFGEVVSSILRADAERKRVTTRRVVRRSTYDVQETA
jgi:hypothetical protein